MYLFNNVIISQYPVKNKKYRSLKPAKAYSVHPGIKYNKLSNNRTSDERLPLLYKLTTCLIMRINTRVDKTYLEIEKFNTIPEYL
jgi:hypothetical protein